MSIPLFSYFFLQKSQDKMQTQTGPRRADIALRVSFTNPLASGSENLSYLTPGFGMFVVFLSLRWHLAQYSYGEGGGEDQNKTGIRSPVSEWSICFAHQWNWHYNGEVKLNDGFAAWCDGTEWWNGCQCQLGGGCSRTLIGWLTKPDEQSVRKVSTFSPSCRCRRPSLATFVLFKQRLNRGEQLLTKVNTSLRAKFDFFYIFWRRTEAKLIAFLIWEDFFSFC